MGQQIANTDQDNKDKQPVPWYIGFAARNKDRAKYIKDYQDKPQQQAINDLYLPAMYHIGEIISSSDAPPQVRLQASQIVINKVIGDKIEIRQQKQVVDVNKLLDQLSSLRAVGISKIDDNPVIDITDMGKHE